MRPVPTVRNRTRQWLILTTKALVAFVLLGMLTLRLDWCQLQQLLRPRLLLSLAGGVVLVLISIGLSAEKLHLLLEHLGFRVGRFKVFRIYLITVFGGNFLPGFLGSDLIKLAYLRRYNISVASLSAAIFMERFSGILVLLILATLGCLHVGARLPAFVGLSSATLLLACLVSLLLLRYWTPPTYAGGGRLVRFLSSGHQACQAFTRDASLISHILMLSVAFMLVCAAQSQVLLYGLGVQLAFIDTMTVVMIVQLLMVLPITISGLGVREWSFMLLLMPLGVSRETAFVLSLGLLVSVLLASLPGLYFMMSLSAPQITPTLTPQDHAPPPPVDH